MPSVPTVGVFIPSTYLNLCNSTTVTGAPDPVTGNPYPTGLNAGKVIEIGDPQAAALTNPATANQLFGGAYQWVQVDSGATAANVAAGRIAFFKLDPGGTAGLQPETGYTNMVVTSQDQADSNNLWAGVFLNSITPGNWGFIFVGAGRVEATYASSVTVGGPAIGDVVGVKASGAGLWDDISATVLGPLALGIAVVTPVANGTSAVYMPNIRYRIQTW